VTPGPWLRLLAIASTVGVAAVVATGEWGLAHDVVANITLVLLAAVVVCARLAYRNRRTLLVASGSAFVLFSLAGLSALAGAPVAVHVALGAAALVAAAVAAAVCVRGGEPVPRASWRDYLTLTKPRIMVLLLLTAAGGMFVGAQGVPPAGLFAATMAGLALACGGASALNHVLDRDIDVHMRRTDKRPVATGRFAGHTLRSRHNEWLPEGLLVICASRAGFDLAASSRCPIGCRCHPRFYQRLHDCSRAYGIVWVCAGA